MNSLAGLLGSTAAPLAYDFRSLREDAAGRGINLYFGFVGNKQIDGLVVAHTLNLLSLSEERNEEMVT